MTQHTKLFSIELIDRSSGDTITADVVLGSNYNSACMGVWNSLVHQGKVRNIDLNLYSWKHEEIGVL